MSSKYDIALLGIGSLANAFSSITKHDTTIYSKPDIDFLLPKSLDINRISKHNIIINTIGVKEGELFDMMQINYLTPMYILEKLIEINYSGKVIFVGSHGSMWTSWPGIDSTRMNYNVSKANLKTYMMSLSQSNLAKFKICLFDTTKFYSKMSDFQGDAIDNVARLIEQLVDLDNPNILHIETY